MLLNRSMTRGVGLKGTPGKGSQFRFTQSKDMAPGNEPGLQWTEMTFLVAEDKLASRELMREVLEASGRRVAEVTNGREALDLIHRDPPDVVFLDLQMPYSTVSVWSANCEAN